LTNTAVYCTTRIITGDFLIADMEENPLERMRELREKNEKIYAEMGMVGSGRISAED